jgi:phosphopantetheine adenylyltransferase
MQASGPRKYMNKYHIRFNHQHNGSGQVWRVFENGTEHLVEHLDIRVPMRDEVTFENEIEKWNVYCEGYLSIDKGIARIEDTPTFDWQKPTVQMLGRWQPWHAGHRALFERAIEKTGQVCIMIRDCQGWNHSNPFDLEQVKKYIRADLDPQYKGRYEIIVVPNIVNITYGRDVGYIIEQETFDDATQAISATAIRKQMGVK